MILKERISVDLAEAVKNKEKEKALVLRSLNAAIKNAEISKRTKIFKAEEKVEDLDKASALTDEEIIGVIYSQIKQRRDSVVEFEKGNRADLAAKEKEQIEILSRYMPEQMGEEEIKKEAREVIEKTGAKTAKDTGKVMAELMKKVKGKADGSLVSKIVKELLAG